MTPDTFPVVVVRYRETGQAHPITHAYFGHRAFENADIEATRLKGEERVYDVEVVPCR